MISGGSAVGEAAPIVKGMCFASETLYTSVGWSLPAYGYVDSHVYSYSTMANVAKPRLATHGPSKFADRHGSDRSGRDRIEELRLQPADVLNDLSQSVQSQRRLDSILTFYP